MWIEKVKEGEKRFGDKGSINYVDKQGGGRGRPYVNDTTGCAKLIFTLCKIAVILAVSTLQKRVIRLWNGNFVGFLGIFSKIMKNVPMKRYFHFSGKWQNRPTRI